MPVVDVLGVGEVEFPDEFTPEQIRDVLREKFATSQAVSSVGEIPYPSDLEPVVEQQFGAPPPTSNKALDLLARVPAGIAENAMLAGQGAGKLIGTLPVPGMIADLIGQERIGEVRDIARSVQERAAEDYGVDPARSGEFSSKLVGGATSIVPVLASGPAAPLVGGAIAGESARQDAEARGATPLQQDIAFFGNAVVGAITEQLLGVPKILKIAREAGGGENIAKSIVARAAVAALKSGASESGQEGLQQFAENWIARDIASYDPERSLQENVGESAVIGGLVGGGLGGTVATAEGLTQRPATEPSFPEAEPPAMVPVQYDPDTGFVKTPNEVLAPDPSGNLKPVQPESAQGKAVRSLLGEEAVTPAPAAPTVPADTPAPVVEETEGTKEQQPIQLPRKIIAPVLSIPGGPERVGKLGQSHKDVRKEATDEDIDLTEGQHMFRLDDGTNVTRADAWQIAKAQGLIKPDVLRYRESRATAEQPAELQTEDLLPLTFTEPATQQGPLSDVLESVNVYLHGPTDITNELRPEVPSVNVTDRVTGNTFQLPHDVTPEEIVTELNKRKRTFKVPEVTLPDSFRGITQPLPFSPREEANPAMMSPEQWVASGRKKGTQGSEMLKARKQGLPINADLFSEVIGGAPEGYVKDGPVFRPKDLTLPPSKMVPEEIVEVAESTYSRRSEIKDALSSHIGQYYDPSARRVEEIFRTRGSEVRAESEKARKLLRDKYGPTLTIYRAQEAFPKRTAARSIFSWTLEKNIAEKHARVGEGRTIREEIVPVEIIEWVANPFEKEVLVNEQKLRFLKRLPVPVSSANAYGLTPPPGYTKQGSNFVSETQPEETTDASQISQATPVYGDVQQPEVTPESQGQVPVPEGGAGVPTPPVTPPAAPTPAPAPSEDPLSIQNAAVDKKREARGLAPRMTELKRSFGFLWNQAMQAVAADPAAGTKLIESLAKNNRTPSDAEQALLLHEMVVRENDYEDAIDAVNNAKDEASRERAQEQLEIAADRNQQAYDVFDASGTSSGRSLNARKMMANRDFSLARMNAETRAIVNEGKPLSKEQLEANKKLSDELSEVRSKLSAIEAKNKILEEQRLVDILKAEEKTRAKEIRAAARQGKSVLDLLEEKKDAAMKRIIDRRGKLNVTIDPLNIAGLVDEAIIGSYYIAKGLKTFTEWSAQMLKDFGNRIEPYLPALFQQSQQYHDANAKLFSEEDLVGKAKADAAAGKNLDPKLIFDLARQKVNQGITELHNVMEAVTKDLQGAYPGITEREVRDEFTGYGKVRYPSKEEDRKKLRELKRIGQLQSAIEDVMKRQAPKRSGAQRDAPTQDVRDKMRELRELMKENGVETTSPEQQLKSVNDARVTQLKNQIADLDKQIRTGQKSKRGPKVPDSSEVERLKSERDAMRELIQEIEDAKNPKLSPDQRQLAKDKRAIKRRMEKLQEKIDKGDYTKTERRAPLMDKEKRELQFKEQKIREKFYRGLLEAEMKKRTPIRKVWDNTMDVLGLLRATKLSIDLGALGRQGGLLARGNPKRGVNALRAGLNAMRSEELHYGQLRDIWERDNGALYKASKLYIPDPTETKLSRLEEEYMSTLVRKVPLLAGSERGHVALLARLRADSFDAIVDAWFDGKPTAKQARAVAEFVNIATGRGELGKFASAVPALNLIFNATSYYASRVQLLGYLARSAMPGSWTGLDPKVANAIRYELAKGVAGNVVWWSLMALAAKALWPEDELEFEINPTSSDFGKIRSGKIVIDPLMGLTQYATLFSRIFSGQMKTKGGTLDLRNPKYGGPTIESVIGTFAGQRLSPNASMFRDLLRQSDYDRRKMSPLVFAENALPISINETYELMRSAGIGPGSALTMAMLLGDGVRVEQDYPGPLHSMFGVNPEYVGKKK